MLRVGGVMMRAGHGPIEIIERGRRLMMCVEYVRDKKTRERLPDRA